MPDTYLSVAYKGVLTSPSPVSHGRVIRQNSDTLNALNTTMFIRPNNTTVAINSTALPLDFYPPSPSFATGSFVNTTAVNMTEPTSSIRAMQKAHSTVPGLNGPSQATRSSFSAAPAVHTEVPNINGPIRTTQASIVPSSDLSILAHAPVPDLNRPIQTSLTPTSSPTGLSTLVEASKALPAAVIITPPSLTTLSMLSTV